MDNVPRTNGKAMPPDLTAQIAHHDAAITALGGRMTGVETGLRTLQGEVHHGFAGIQQTMNSQIGSLSSKLDKLDAAPKFDFHKTVSTVVAIAVLFSMICGGIVWIAGGQFSASFAKQDSFNAAVSKTLERHDTQIERISDWVTTVHVKVPKRGERSQ